MFKTGGTQQLFGIWVVPKQAWVRDSTGSVALFGRPQAEALVSAGEGMVLKEVFICCAEDLDDSELLRVRQRWAERDRMREALYGPDIAQAASR